MIWLVQWCRWATWFVRIPVRTSTTCFIKCHKWISNQIKNLFEWSLGVHEIGRKKPNCGWGFGGTSVMLNWFSLVDVCSEFAIICERFRKNKFSEDSVNPVVNSSSKSLSVSVVTLFASSAAKAIAISFNWDWRSRKQNNDAIYNFSRRVLIINEKNTRVFRETFKVFKTVFAFSVNMCVATTIFQLLPQNKFLTNCTFLFVLLRVFEKKLVCCLELLIGN